MQFWSRRLSRLDSVRNQLNSVVVLNILHNLEQAHSTYAQAFIHVHRLAPYRSIIIISDYITMFDKVHELYIIHQFSPKI